MSSHPWAETIEAHDCRVVMRRVEGPEANELFLLCQPSVDTSDATEVAEAVDASQQAEAIYRALRDVLAAEGAGFDCAVSETLFLANLRSDLEAVRAARQRVVMKRMPSAAGPVTTEIEQPPLDARTCLAVSLQAVVPHGRPLRREALETGSACRCAECARPHGLRLDLGGEVRVHAGGLCGSGADAYEQAVDMFGAAEALLQRAGMEFRDVARTWIHLRDIERDYDALNRARRAFFAARRIDPIPASTGIGGGPAAAQHHLCLGLYAVREGASGSRTPMTAATLNEAPSYGADFARGMRSVETNKIALHVSGTASIDEAGRTAHPGDFEAQADRMLVNVAALLESQGASFRDVVSAVTYLKRPEDARRLREKLHEAGYVDFPNLLVKAAICRSDLLCETEALAVLPRVDVPRSSAG